MDEIHWIQHARKGDLESFNCLVLACQDLVFQHAIWMLGESAAAEDVTQTAFILAFHELSSFRERGFHIWLLRIANRLCLEKLCRREQGHYIPLGGRDNGGREGNSASQVHGLVNSSEGNIDLHDLEEILREGLRELAPDLRAVLTLVDLQRMDYHNTAKILGTSEGMVKSHLARARVQIGVLLCASRWQEALDAIADTKPGIPRSATNDLHAGIEKRREETDDEDF